MPNTVFRAVVLFGLFALLLAATVLGAWIPADAKLWELRFRAADRPPSGEIVFVDIDASSLAEVGTWPWPRALHGQLVDRLLDIGAYEIAFDIDFSTASNSADDAAFAQSLQRAGGYVFLAAFRQLNAMGVEVWNRPIAAFAAYAEEALVNVDSLEAGMVWSLPGRNDVEGLHSIAGKFNHGKLAPESLHIDYSIDLTRIVRVPASAVLDGTVDPGLIYNRQIVIGSSALELHDLLLVPRFGVVAGPLVQIAAAETLRQDRALRDLGSWPALSLGVIFLLASLVLPRMKLGLAVAVSIAATMVLEVTAGLLFILDAIQIDTTAFHVFVATVVVVRLLEERAMRRRQLREYHQRLEYLVDHDDQTGALSPLAWRKAVDYLEGIGHRTRTLLLRLEQLDGTGASLGFAVSDQAVMSFRDRLSRAIDLPIARIESHTFALAVSYGLGESEVLAFIDRLGTPLDVEGHLVLVSLRYGLSAKGGAVSSEEALQQARTALAMASRKNIRGCHYHIDLESELQQRRSLDIALRTAIEKQELDIAFQLQVDTKTRTAIGAEALLRWSSDAFGRVSPAEFIPLAEDNGTIVELGSWVLHEACRRAVASGWQGRLSVNVSPIQFASSDVVAMVCSALDETGFPAGKLDIEVTESVVAGGEGAILEALNDLRALGVSIAIDDFGTGHSSLSHIATLPVDKLKIDMSFVRQITTAKGVAVAETIARLGAELGLLIVVEGVETEHEFDFFAALGCDCIQGYLFSRPGPLPQTLALETAA